MTIISDTAKELINKDRKFKKSVKNMQRTKKKLQKIVDKGVKGGCRK